MHVPELTLAAIALLGLCWMPASISAEPAQGGVRGAVTDGSGGVLPGVTVVATSADGVVIATTVTNAVGGYAFGALPAGPVRLIFQLEAFATAIVGLAVKSGTESVVTEHLELAAITETVVVHGHAPDPPDRRPAPTPPPPAARPVPRHDQESICGPAKPGATAEAFGTILSLRHETERGLYAKDDELLIDGGTLNGLDVGQNLVVRRYYHVSGVDGAAGTGEHTSGLLQIVAADERASRAVVVYACDEMMRGDFLASFHPEPVRIPDPVGIPAYKDAARILFADAGQMLGVPGRLMVIDQGSEHGIRPGQRLTLFRRAVHGATRPSVVGDAVIVAVRTGSATIRVERVTDAISFGDWAAPQRRSPVASPSAIRALQRR
jgi:hypothetical protein